MRTHKEITNKLERRIIANALLTLRNIGKPKVGSKWFIYISAWDGLAMDECHVDAETWELKKIYYRKVKENGIENRTIILN